jgi:hypothetical protein
MRLEVTTAKTQRTLYVIATRFEGTRPALETAIPLARGSRARLVLLVPQIVPYPLPVDGPAEATAFVERRYCDLVHEMDGEAAIKILLCRTLNDVLAVIPRAATVVVGGASGSVLPSREERLTRCLTHLGHRVIFTPPPRGS